MTYSPAPLFFTYLTGHCGHWAGSLALILIVLALVLVAVFIHELPCLALPAKPSGSFNPPSLLLLPLAANQHLTTALHRNSTSPSPLHASELHRYHLFQVNSRTRTAPIYDATRQIARPFESTYSLSHPFSTLSRRPGQNQTSAIVKSPPSNPYPAGPLYNYHYYMTSLTNHQPSKTFVKSEVPSFISRH